MAQSDASESDISLSQSEKGGVDSPDKGGADSPFTFSKEFEGFDQVPARPPCVAAAGAAVDPAGMQQLVGMGFARPLVRHMHHRGRSSTTGGFVDRCG